MSGWAALAGALGLVALVFSLLSFLILLFGGGGVQASSDLAWVGGNLVVGIVLLGMALFSSLDTLRERMQSGEARRVGKYGTSSIVSTLLAVAILSLLAYLGTQNNVRWDWTEAGVHSLSDQTVKVLAGLDRDVEVLAFYAKVAQPEIRPLLERFEYASERFRVTYADPTARPDLAEKFNLTREQLAAGLLHVTLGDESTVVDNIDEERLTNALVKLTRTGEKRVYFLSGHNERPASDEAATGEGGFGRAADALRNENYLVESLVLATRGDVPEDADAVIVAGPTRPFLAEEHQALQRYLERGGSLLVMIDPMAQTDLFADLEGWGVRVGEGFVIDQVQGLFGRAATPLAAQYAPHPIVEDLREVTMFHLARSVEPAEGATGLQAIVFTGENSWGESNIDDQPELGPDDRPGPVPIAVAGTPRLAAADDQAAAEDATPEPAGGEARLVVFGDSDFASNELIDAYRNRDLFLNSVNWLVGDVEAISIRPNQARASRFQLTSDQFGRIRTLSLFVLPQLLAMLGAVSWWLRRRAPGR